MRFEALSNGSNFGARVTNVDLQSLQDSTQVRQIVAGLYRYGVLVFDQQNLTESEYINFGKTMGTIKVFVDEAYRHPDYAEIFVVSNLQREGKRVGMDRVGLYWHSDCSFLAEPQPLTALYCQIAPEKGGETEFIDMRAFWDKIPEQNRAALRNSVCEHEGQSRYIITEHDVGLSISELLMRDRNYVPPVQHPAVFRHPFSGREILYVNEGFTSKIIGIDPEESTERLNSIFSLIRATTDRYLHIWRRKQIVMWDNRSVLHRAFSAEPGCDRLMFRLGISDGSFFKGTAL